MPPVLSEDEVVNRPAQLLDLLGTKSDNAAMSLKDKLNGHLLQAPPGAGSKDPISINELIQVDPTVSNARLGSQGNLAAANVFWRNQTLNGGPFSVADMNTMYNRCSDGSDPVRFYLASQTIYEYYENSQVGQIRYGDSRLAGAGFESLMYKQKPMIWDANMTITDRLFYLNTAYFKLVLMVGADFITTPFVTPENQVAKVAKILWMGNLICDNRRRCGVIHTITAPA